MKLLLALLLGGTALPGAMTVKQGKGAGTNDAWSVECTNCGGSGGSSSSGLIYVVDAGVLNVNPVAIAGGTVSVQIVDAGAPLNVQGSVTATIANLDVALSTRTKPADQQHTIIDSSASIAVTGPVTDAQLRASAVPVSLATAPTTPVTGTFFQATQPISGTVAVSSVGGTTAVSAAALPLPSGAATDSTLSQLLDGGVLQLGRSPTGLGVPVAVDVSGAQYVVVPLPTRNPFLPRCNPVRRTGCQP